VETGSALPTSLSQWRLPTYELIPETVKVTAREGDEFSPYAGTAGFNETDFEYDDETGRYNKIPTRVETKQFSYYLEAGWSSP
jgi:hypothetical protein